MQLSCLYAIFLFSGFSQAMQRKITSVDSQTVLHLVAQQQLKISTKHKQKEHDLHQHINSLNIFSQGKERVDALQRADRAGFKADAAHNAHDKVVMTVGPVKRPQAGINAKTDEGSQKQKGKQWRSPQHYWVDNDGTFRSFPRDSLKMKPDDQ